MKFAVKRRKRFKKLFNLNFDYSWKTFSSFTSIHGLYQIYNNKALNRKIIWFIIFTAMLALCLWQCIYSVQTYFTFDTITSTTYETFHEIEFPAFTLIIDEYMRRTVAGRNDRLRTMLVWAYGKGNNSNELFKQLKRTCNFQKNYTDDLDRQLEQMDVNKLRSSTFDEMLSYVSMGIFTKEMLFAKCWWNEIELDCKKIVLTMSSDVGFAFVVNWNHRLADFYAGDGSTFSQLNRNYDRLQEKKIANRIGKSNGFRFLINVNRDDICIIENIFKGIKVMGQIHDPGVVPIHNVDSQIYLTPGYDYTISIKPNIYRRKIEHIGKCKTSLYLYSFPETSTYFQGLCYAQCLVESFWNSCRCLPPISQRFFKTIANKYHVNESTMAYCEGSSSVCFDKHKVVVEMTPLHVLCPRCMQSCNETKYKYQISSSKFSEKNTPEYYYKELNVSDAATFANNFISLQLQIDSFDTIVIEETQLFTLKDMWIYIGNSIGLFMGMSFMSFAEIIYQFPLTIIRTFQKLKTFTKFHDIKRKKKRRVIRRRVQIGNMYGQQNVFTRRIPQRNDKFKSVKVQYSNQPRTSEELSCVEILNE